MQEPGSQAPPEGEEGPPQPAGPPYLPFITRIVLYLLITLVAQSLGFFLVASLIAVLVPDSPLRIALESGKLEEPLGLGTVLLIQALLLPLVVVVTLVYLRRIDGKSPAAIGLARPGAAGRGGRDVLHAVAAVGVLLGLWWLFASAMGGVELEGWADAFRARATVDGPSFLGSLVSLLLFALGFAAYGAVEECMFRGYVYSTLRERLKWPNAAGGTAVFATVLILGNPEITTAGMLNTFLLNLALGALRERSGTLWAAIAAHGLWNFLIACVLSLPLSGLPAFHVFEVTTSGPVWLTGGGYGPEGSWALTALLLLLVLGLTQLLGSDDAEAPEEAAS